MVAIAKQFVISGKKYTSAGLPVTGQQFGYDFDDIGNRKSENRNGDISTYIANNVNQYTQRTVLNIPETYTYDDDGNMLTDGRFTYTWNGENRLISQIQTGVQKLEYQYDYQGRRFEKKVYSWNTSTSTWDLDKTLLFTYDGYLQIANFDVGASTTLNQSFLWAGMQPLTMKDHTSSVYYLYIHDGNKNVMNLIKASDASTVAEYEYDPFGRTIISNGTLADSNPFRFSSEYADDETGLVYYNYRYYNPDTGRWTNRDPIEEDGGTNLYGMVENNPIAMWDYLGKWAAKEHKNITEFAFKMMIRKLKNKEVPCSKKVLAKLKKANVSQDNWGLGGGVWENKRHYNRDVGADEHVADALYGSYILSEENLYKRIVNHHFAGWLECQEALEAIGRVSHSWQDFFMHAIRRDGKGGKENSTKNGWTAWSKGVKGTPENRLNFFPSSWAFSGDSEHPPGMKGEPVLYPESPEGRMRFNAAVRFTRDKFISLLPKWCEKCKCNCKYMGDYLL